MGAKVRRAKDQQSSCECVIVKPHLSNGLLPKWPFLLSGKPELREESSVIGDDPPCALWAATEPENVPPGKVLFGE